VNDFDDEVSDLRAQRSQLLLRLLTLHGALGAAVGVALVAGLVLLNVGGLGDLAGGRDGWFGVGLLAFLFALTFSSAAMGVAVMSLSRRKPPAPPGKRAATPAAIAVGARR